MFTYDAIGSYERTNYSCQGSGQALIMPVLDNQLKAVSPLLHPPRSSATPLSEAEALDLVKDCFASAGGAPRACLSKPCMPVLRSTILLHQASATFSRATLWTFASSTRVAFAKRHCN